MLYSCACCKLCLVVSLTSQQFDRGVDLRPETFVPPFYGNVPITAQHGHGETCAAMAVGTQLGVANHATLVAVKLKGGTGSSRTEALYEAFRFVLQDVRSKSREGKAVMSCSGCENFSHLTLFG